MRLRTVVSYLILVFTIGTFGLWWYRDNRMTSSAPKSPPSVHLANHRACSSYNNLANSQPRTLLFHCLEADSVAQDTCTYPHPDNRTESSQSMKLTSQKQAQLGFDDDVLIYVVIGSTSNSDALLWWLPLLRQTKLDIVFVGDACKKVQAANGCEDDSLSDIFQMVQRKHKHQRFHLVRANPHDAGYDKLSCKLRSGAASIYKLFPQKKVYFKIDTDTVVMPHLLLQFLQSLDNLADLSTKPVYFGTVLEGRYRLLLCGWEDGAARGDISRGGLCYAQGGAGYGLSNVAMRALAASPKCNESPTDNAADDPEDMFTATVLYESLGIVVTHCSSFTSGRRVRNAITYHYLGSKWLKSHTSMALTRWTPWST